MARPTKLDDLIGKRVCDAVARGLPRRTAAKLAGVAPSSLFLWLKKGREGHEDYSDFSERVAAAEAKGEDELMGYMREHAKLSHSACAWLLERRNPAAYASRRPERVEPPSNDLSLLTDEQLMAMKAIWESAMTRATKS